MTFLPQNKQLYNFVFSYLQQLHLSSLLFSRVCCIDSKRRKINKHLMKIMQDKVFFFLFKHMCTDGFLRQKWSFQICPSYCGQSLRVASSLKSMYIEGYEETGKPKGMNNSTQRVTWSNQGWSSKTTVHCTTMLP